MQQQLIYTIQSKVEFEQPEDLQSTAQSIIFRLVDEKHIILTNEHALGHRYYIARITIECRTQKYQNKNINQWPVLTFSL